MTAPSLPTRSSRDAHKAADKTIRLLPQQSVARLVGVPPLFCGANRPSRHGVVTAARKTSERVFVLEREGQADLVDGDVILIGVLARAEAVVQQVLRRAGVKQVLSGAPAQPAGLVGAATATGVGRGLQRAIRGHVFVPGQPSLRTPRTCSIGASTMSCRSRWRGRWMRVTCATPFGLPSPRGSVCGPVRWS